MKYLMYTNVMILSLLLLGCTVIGEARENEDGNILKYNLVKLKAPPIAVDTTNIVFKYTHGQFINKYLGNSYIFKTISPFKTNLPFSGGGRKPTTGIYYEDTFNPPGIVMDKMDKESQLPPMFPEFGVRFFSRKNLSDNDVIAKICKASPHNFPYAHDLQHRYYIGTFGDKIFIGKDGKVCNARAWPIGIHGYILFANRMFVDKSNHATMEIDSQKLRRLIAATLARYRLIRKLNKVDKVEIHPKRTRCNCLYKEGSKESINLIEEGKAECINRDSEGRQCAGSIYTQPARYRNRWFCDYNKIKETSKLPVVVSDRGYRIFTNGRYKFVFPRYWCELDPYFPCTPSYIYLLERMHGDPREKIKMMRLRFGRFMMKRVTGAVYVPDNYIDDSNIRLLDEKSYGILREWQLVSWVNSNLDKFRKMEFAFIALPIAYLQLKGIKLNGLLPVDIINNNANVIESINKGNYSLFRQVNILVSDTIEISGSVYLEYLYANENNDFKKTRNKIEYLANSYKNKMPSNIIWFTPIQH